ncbi:PLDc N-terminal domain-containing protein [Leptospira sp. 96542]|nr:PLDc N-terminal domain-containing protein [Leptospira sp. 96542]
METNFATPGFWTYFIGSYAYYLPFVLTTVWAPIALYDLSGKSNLESWKTILWALVILIVPVFGGAAYILLAENGFSKKFKQTAVGGGLTILILVWVLSVVSHI